MLLVPVPYMHTLVSTESRLRFACRPLSEVILTVLPASSAAGGGGINSSPMTTTTMTSLDQNCFTFKQQQDSLIVCDDNGHDNDRKRARLESVEDLFRSTPLDSHQQHQRLRKYTNCVGVAPQEHVYLTSTFNLPAFSCCSVLTFNTLVMIRYDASAVTSTPALTSSSATSTAAILQHMHCGTVSVSVDDVMKQNASTAHSAAATLLALSGIQIMSVWKPARAESLMSMYLLNCCGSPLERVQRA